MPRLGGVLSVPLDGKVRPGWGGSCGCKREGGRVSEWLLIVMFERALDGIALVWGLGCSTVWGA